VKLRILYAMLLLFVISMAVLARAQDFKKQVIYQIVTDERRLSGATEKQFRDPG
jgi:hypothetical protein